MVECGVCGAEFRNNRAGQLTKHLLDVHGMTKEDYVVYVEYNNKYPHCECGYCDERPSFYRGVFRKYATGHESHSYREAKYLEKYGAPLCLECASPTIFRRGEPLRYCSFTCVGKNFGFSLDSVQENIRKSVQEKYGVDNVSKLDFVKAKISEFSSGMVRLPITEETRRNHSDASKRMWQDPDFREKVTKALQESAKSPEIRKIRSENMKAQWRDPTTRQALFENLKKHIKFRVSGLHLRIKNDLDLEAKGFISEQSVGRYVVDELNIASKIAIEVNGDYVHANPQKYKEDDIIRLPGNSYTAADKWRADAKKIKALELAGYRVLVIWESDDIEDFRPLLEEMLNED